MFKLNPLMPDAANQQIVANLLSGEVIRTDELQKEQLSTHEEPIVREPSAEKTGKIFLRGPKSPNSISSPAIGVKNALAGAETFEGKTFQEAQVTIIMEMMDLVDDEWVSRRLSKYSH